MLATAHGSNHGLVPNVQYSKHYSLPDIHSPHHSAPSTFFTPGGSLAIDPYLISAPGPSTVTQDEPVDEVMSRTRTMGWIHKAFLVSGSVVYSIAKLLIGMLL